MANPIQQAAVRRKAGYVFAIIGLFTLTLFWRGKLDVPFSRPEVRDAAGAVVQAGNLPQRLTDASVLGRAEKLELRELDQGEAEVTGSVVRLGLTGSRGVAITALWWSAIEKKKRNEFNEFELLVKAVTRLQPNFITPWIFSSWDIAYNVSVENDKLADTFYYIARGLDLLAEGDRLNTKTVRLPSGAVRKIGSPDIRYTAGFSYQNKFGVSDKVQTLRCLMQLAAIPPTDRAASNLQTPGRGVDPARFREFCEKYPQLVRRLKTKLNCTSPEDVVAFLRDNDKVPGVYKAGTGELAAPEEQFPVLPPRFEEGPDEYTAAGPFDDRFDAFHAARAWFTYANAVVPPAKVDETGEPLPWATPRAGDPEYNPFLHRVPRQPTLIIFKIAPARAQSYLAERLAKEGWFEETTTWSPDDRGGGSWFGPAAGAVALKATDNSLVQYDRAWRAWNGIGQSQGLVVDAERYNRLAERSRRLKYGGNGLPPDMTPEQMVAAEVTPADLDARRALVYYDQNRSMTNFAFFLDSSLAEKDPLTVRARNTLFDADQARQAAENTRAARLYVEGLARWREVLSKYPRFHRANGDPVEEATYEYELALINLLKDEGAVRARADRAVDALRAVAPAGADLDTSRADLRQAFAEDEAYSRIVAEQLTGVFLGMAPDTAEGRAVRRAAGAAEAAAAAVGPVALAPAGRQPVSRGLIDTEFAWMKEAAKEPPQSITDTQTPASPEDFWVRPYVRDAVRSRLGLKRQAVTTPQTTDPAPPAAEKAEAVPQR